MAVFEDCAEHVQVIDPLKPLRERLAMMQNARYGR
jgi:hypothetical protein